MGRPCTNCGGRVAEQACPSDLCRRCENERYHAMRNGQPWPPEAEEGTDP